MVTSWQEIPFFRPFLLVLLSVVLFEKVSIFNGYWGFLILGIICLFIYLEKKVMALPLQGGLIMLLIVCLAGWRVDQRSSVPISNFENYIIDTTQYIAVKVSEEPKLGKRYRAVGSVQLIGTELGKMKSCTGKIMIYFPEEIEKPDVNDLYLIHSKIQDVVNNTNPYTFDWKSYLHNRGIKKQLFLKTGQIAKTGSDNSYTMMSTAKNCRTVFQNILSKYISSDRELGIAYAMILGYKNKLDEDLYDAYTDTGAVHTLAVSGLHVGIMASILSILLSFFPSRSRFIKIVKFFLLSGGIWFYVLLTGAGPAIVRAAIMFTIIICDFYWSDSRNILNSLCAAGFLMVIYDPFIIYQAGFQFSFLALIGIIVFYKPINRLIPFINNNIIRYLWGLICVSIAAQITVFPITVYYFHKFPSFFWLSGMIAVPLAFVILALGVALIISHYIIPVFSQFIGEIVQATIKLLNSLIVEIQQLPNSSNDHLWLDTPQLLLIYLFIILTGLAIYSKIRFNYALVGCTLIAFIAYGTYKEIKSNNQLEVMVYDIYGGTVIDIFDGLDVYTYKSIPRKDQSEKFMCDNYRMSKSITSHTYINYDSAKTGNRVLIKNGYVLSPDKTLLIAQSSYANNVNRNIDYLILTSTFKGDLKKLIDNTNPSMVVLDKSMDWNTYYFSKEYLTSINQPVSNLFDTGALKINL